VWLWWAVASQASFVVGVPATLADLWIFLLLLFAELNMCGTTVSAMSRMRGPVCGFSFELIGKLCLSGAAHFYNYTVYLPCIDLHLL
jgi:hypothetical protein